MPTLFSIILPLLAIRLFLNPVPSFSLSSPSLLSPSRLPVLPHSLPPPSTPISITYRHFHSSSFAVHHHHSVHPSSTLVAILFSFFFSLEIDVEINPGPNCPFSRRPLR